MPEMEDYNDAAAIENEMDEAKDIIDSDDTPENKLSLLIVKINAAKVKATAIKVRNS